MPSIMEIMQMCRLCLVKDQVNIPIFEEQGDIRQIFLKITACLPVKVAKEDNLPKKICDGCLYKLELLYQFWNTTANAEKQLLNWLDQAGMDVNKTTTAAAMAVVSQSQEPVGDGMVKQENIDSSEVRVTNDASNDDAISDGAQSYILQQQQLPYEPFSFGAPVYDGGKQKSTTSVPSATVTREEGAEPPAKRAKRAAAMKNTVISQDTASDEEDDDLGADQEEITKMEDDSDLEGEEVEGEDSQDPEPTQFVDVPSTSTDVNQPGPSGVGKTPADTPLSEIETESDPVQPPPPCKYECVFCDKSFLDKISLKKHLLTHMAVKQTNSANQGFRKILPRPPTVTYTCSICKRIFTNFGLCKTHIKKHTMSVDVVTEGEKRDLCEICGDQFTVAAMGAHLKSHRDKSYACETCGRTFTANSSLKIHSQTHTNEKRFKCSECDKMFTQGVSLTLHVRSAHSKRKQFECQVCNRRFVVRGLMERHCKAAHGVEFPDVAVGKGCAVSSTGQLLLFYVPIQPMQNTAATTMSLLPTKPKLTPRCGLCGMEFPNIKERNRHVKVHYPFPCNKCNKRLASEEGLQVHKKLKHTEEQKEFKCEYCDKHYTNKYVFNSHVKSHTTENAKYRCTRCGRILGNKSSLEDHMQALHEGVQHICNFCGATYKHRRSFKGHLETHAPNYSKVKCEYCDKYFMNEGLKKVHIKDQHSDQKGRRRKTFVCDVCGVAVSELKKHLMMHAGEKPVVCEVCGSSFRTKQALKVHSVTHTREKPHECPDCGKKFTQRSPLMLHIRSVHKKEKPFKCRFCDTKFLTSTLMKTHVKKKHGTPLAEIATDIKKN